MENIELKLKIENDKYILEEATSSNIGSIYPITSLLWCGDTLFCKNVIIANSNNFGKMLFTDGELQSTSNDEKIYHEYLIHPSLCIYYSLYDKYSLNILVLGGGEGATTRELLKYPKEIINKIIWIDIDKNLIDLSRLYLKYCEEDVYKNDRVFLSCEDANDFLKDSKDKFDIIICDLPDPCIINNNINENNEDEDGLYSKTFWNNLKKLTKEEHIIVTHLGPISPGEKNFELCKSVLNQINLNKINYKFGKVFISSFMSEWLYLYFSFNKSLENIKLNTNNLPSKLSVIDKENINYFFYFPKYYKFNIINNNNNK